MECRAKGTASRRTGDKSCPRLGRRLSAETAHLLSRTVTPGRTGRPKRRRAISGMRGEVNLSRRAGRCYHRCKLGEGMMSKTGLFAACAALALLGWCGGPKTDANGFTIDPDFENRLQQQLLDA